MRQSIYTVRTTSGITFHIEAKSYPEASQRASDPAIGKEIARMILNAVSNISDIEPCRGSVRGKLVFEDEFFR